MSPRCRAGEERHRRAALRALLPKAALLGVSEEELLHRALFIRREAGGAFALPGDMPDLLYVVGLGAVMTTVPLRNDHPLLGPRHGLDQFIVQIAKPGQVVGLGPLGATHGSVRFGATALTAATVVGFSRHFLTDVLRRQAPETRLLVAAYHTRVMSRLLHDVCRLLPASLDHRLSLRLAVTCCAFPAPADPFSIDPRLGLDQTRIGELVGATRGSVNKALRRLVEAGVLRPTLPHIRFVSLPKVAPCLDGTSGSHLPRPSSLEDDWLRRELGLLLAHRRPRMHLSPAASAVLLRRAELHCYERNERIAVADELFATFLVSGVARVECVVEGGRRAGVWMARPGHFVGAGWIGNTGRAPLFAAWAHERCVVARLRPEVMIEALETLDGDQLLQFHGYCHAALSRHLYDKYRLLGLDADGALFYQLRLLAETFPERHQRGTVIRLDLTDCREVAPRMLAEFIGVIPTTAAKAFSSLLRDGHVDFINGRILLPGFWPSAEPETTRGCARRQPG
jgi:CRP-like cAMP-binding protein